MAHRIIQLLALGLIALAALPFQHDTVRAAGKPLIIVMGASSPLKDISSGLLRRAFLGERAEYGSGKRLIPINHPPGSPTRNQFDLGLLGLKPDAVGRFWIDRRIRDQPPPPKAAPSIELAVRLVASLPDAVTYVSPEYVDNKLRVLTVDGKAAGQPGYLFAN